MRRYLALTRAAVLKGSLVRPLSIGVSKYHLFWDTEPASIGRYSSGVGLAAYPPAMTAARSPPQRELALVFLS